MKELTASWVKPSEGLLAHLLQRLRPGWARHIERSGRIDTAVIGLGRQGERHAGLMRQFGTAVVAAVAPGRQGTRVHETIPVYASVSDMLRDHPHVAAVSIWKHFSTARDTAIEVIESGIPMVVLITEGIPVKDVRDIVAASRRNKVLLLGPNTPGVIFPPERVKIGMLPDVFYPAESQTGRFSADGVSICSRSGAILYHISDALASAGIAQNAVIGVGGDSVVGTPFSAIVPAVMDYPSTDLVVVAGEIGGCQEELLAQDMKDTPGNYPKPMVALISGKRAPEGKRMGHAGALVAPGTQYGSFEAKKAALESAGVVVVNSQRALIDAVRKTLGGRTYFSVSRYYAHMQTLWDAPPPKESWSTVITDVRPNNLAVRGRPLAELIGKRSFLDTAALLVTGRFPNRKARARLDDLARCAAMDAVPNVRFAEGDHLSKRLAAMLLADTSVARFAGSDVERTAFCIGRMAAYFAKVFRSAVRKDAKEFAELACAIFLGQVSSSPAHARVIEAAIVASADHGVTPPSTQATIIAASVRAGFEVALANGLSAITHVHGGAGADAARFFQECAALAERTGVTLREATEEVIRKRIAEGGRVAGMGHRIHTQDPRRNALWKLAAKARVAGPCVAISQIVEDAFESVRGMRLPLNVDGVIGAIVADMRLDARVATALFVFGRAAGLAAHYFEEVNSQVPMRRIDFSRAVYMHP